MTPTPISQSFLKSCQKLLLKKYRDQEGKYLIEGAHLVGEALSSGANVQSLLITAEFSQHPDAPAILRRAGKRGVPVLTVSPQISARLSDMVSSQGVSAVVAVSQPSLQTVWRKSAPASLVVALDAVADPGNLGTIIRTADWFGADAVVVSAGAVDLYNPKVLRATMGSLYHLPVISGVSTEDLIAAARAHGYTIIATVSRDGLAPSRGMFSDRTILLFGSEANGLPGRIVESADIRLTIPRFGSAESLNVAMSVASLLSYIRLP